MLVAAIEGLGYGAREMSSTNKGDSVASRLADTSEVRRAQLCCVVWLAEAGAAYGCTRMPQQHEISKVGRQYQVRDTHVARGAVIMHEG